MDISELADKRICERHFLECHLSVNSKRKLLRQTAVPKRYDEQDDEETFITPVSPSKPSGLKYGCKRRRKPDSCSNTDSESSVFFQLDSMSGRNRYSSQPFETVRTKIRLQKKKKTG
ncbi:hypothetical protein QE152_g38645 [Popillia japonica]|uniref:THAP-type domain-containing protein n=1 Tax=Popillia japonica TaxID=7064 RepID=A0AAW1HX37_POPJA